MIGHEREVGDERRISPRHCQSCSKFNLLEMDLPVVHPRLTRIDPERIRTQASGSGGVAHTRAKIRERGLKVIRFGIILVAPLVLAIASAQSSPELLTASRSGDLETVQSLLKEGADASSTDNTGLTALMYAAGSGHLEVAQALVDAGADINRQGGSKSFTALMLAGFRGHGEIVQRLLDAGADSSLQNSDGMDAYVLTSTAGHEEIAALLKPDPKPESAPPAAPPSPSPAPAVVEAPVLFRCDADCELRIDTKPSGSLKAKEAHLVKLAVGEHLIEADSSDGAGTWEGILAIDRPTQRIVAIEMKKATKHENGGAKLDHRAANRSCFWAE